MNEKILNTSHCQVEIVKYNDRDYKVQSDKNGFRFIKVSDFVRKAISEKIKRDYAELQDKPKKEYCPF